jgi:hypothetical protein
MLVVITTLVISGLGAQIVNLPYAQDFDTVVTPGLPIGWQSIVSTPDANIRTDNINPHSNPNCLRIYSGSSAVNEMFLISPEIQNAAPLNSLRLRFWIRSSSNTATLLIGVLGNPGDTATYEQMYDVQAGPAWQEIVLSFSTYTVEGRYIAIKYTPTGGNTYFFLDDIYIESIPQNDLAVLSICGNPTPTINLPVTYQIDIENYGLNTQTAYQVKLYGLGGIQLGSVSGTPVSAGATVTVSLPWTPVTPGLNIVHAVVELTNDEFAYNDSSPDMNISVITAVVIPPFPPTQLQRLPLDFFYTNSLCQYILYPSEFTYPPTSGVISSIELVYDFLSNIYNTPSKIWMGTTTQSDLSGGWIPISQLTLVYEGSIGYPSGGNAVRYQLTQPFNYNNGQNLVFMFYRPWDTQYYSSFDKFVCWAASESRNRRVFSDTVQYDPNNLPASSTLSSLIPVTRVYMYPFLVSSLNGTVRDDAGLAVPNVTVNMGSYSTTTSADGSYAFTDKAVGEYILYFSKAGFYPYAQNVNISASQPLVLETELYRRTGYLRGLVLDEEGIPLQGATANLSNYTALTNETGVFNFTVPVGSYSLNVSMPGMLSQSFSGVQIQAEQYLDYNITLHPGSAADDQETPALSTTLINCYPNPFVEQTTLRYQLKQKGEVSLEIYNLKGQRVRNLISSSQNAGNHETIWNGRNDNGDRVGNGVYFCRMRAGEHLSTKRLLKLESK